MLLKNLGHTSVVPAKNLLKKSFFSRTIKKKKNRNLWHIETLFCIINYNLKTVNVIKQKIGIIRPCLPLHKQHKAHKYDLDCFYDNRKILSPVQVLHFRW